MDVAISEENKGNERWISVKVYWKKCENVLDIFPDTQDNSQDGGYPPCLQCGRLPAVGSHLPHPVDGQLKHSTHVRH